VTTAGRRGKPQAAPDRAAAGGAGTLYVVATPIGNLGDISARATAALRDATLVVAEDTRRTRALLSHLGIEHKRTLSLNAHASPRAVADVVAELAGGAVVAYATDAGTPAVSDPGRALVEQAVLAGIDTRIVPGPSAVTAAVALSGMVDASFSFLGFVPRRGAARQALISRLQTNEEPIVLFESPERMAETLSELARALPERRAFIGRELTKLHEQSLHGTLAELAELEQVWRGEITFVVASAPPQPVAAETNELVDACLRAAIECGVSPSRIAGVLAKAGKLPRRPLYARALELAGADSSVVDSTSLHDSDVAAGSESEAEEPADDAREAAGKKPAKADDEA
jgi:16S rRNA (cytidine1402-2'-O)-methyltransferase